MSFCLFIPGEMSRKKPITAASWHSTPQGKTAITTTSAWYFRETRGAHPHYQYSSSPGAPTSAVDHGGPEGPTDGGLEDPTAAALEPPEAGVHADRADMGQPRRLRDPRGPLALDNEVAQCMSTL